MREVSHSGIWTKGLTFFDRMGSPLTKSYSLDGAMTVWIITELRYLLGPSPWSIRQMNVLWPDYQAALELRHIYSIVEEFLNIGGRWL